MQFFFVIFLSIILGASTLPHFLQAPNRPTFSVRKNTSFSLIAIPKFIRRVTNLERDPTRKTASIGAASAPVEINSDKIIDEETPKEAPPPIKKAAQVSVTASRLNSCICRAPHSMECYLFVEGTCSEKDSSVELKAAVDGFPSGPVEVRCSHEGNYKGRLRVSGGGMGTYFVNHKDAQATQYFGMTNPCGVLKDDPRSDEEQ